MSFMNVCYLPYSSTWMEEMSACITNVDDLKNYLQLLDHDDVFDWDSTFKLRVTKTYLDKIEKGNIHDPLLRQILPLTIENKWVDGFVHDPINENEYMPVEGLLHKYKGRVLIITTAACPIHCRYCFRRHFPYEQSHVGHNNWQSIVNYIQSDNSINEVILSGGDPLSLSNDKLERLLEQLNNIEHIQSIRFHTRFLSTLPSRIDQGLMALLSCFSDKIVIITHINHANEMDEDVKQAVQKIRQTGIILFNQSVLLAGVNDSLAILSQLNKTLFAMGIIPYYLHLLDKVEGAAHFLVDDTEVIMLVNQMRKSLPGYLVPRLVRENGGDSSKEIIRL